MRTIPLLCVSSLTIALNTFPCTAAQPEHTGPREILIHLPNPYPGEGPDAGIPGVGIPGHAGKPGGGVKSNGINYHGGPVMLGTVNMYYIWYGNWAGNSAVSILEDFARSIGGSPYYNINTTYYDGASRRVANSVVFAGSITDNYSQGATALTDGAIQAIVTSAIGAGRLPADPNGVYFVLTSADVTKSGFCTSYCGWHSHAAIAGLDIKYSFVGNPAQCITSCAAQSIGPNGNAGADGMVSIIAHELEETTTDPDLNAWWDVRGYENADKCAWTFGTTYSVNGALANVHLGSRDYLIQRNWVNAAGGYCSMAYP